MPADTVMIYGESGSTKTSQAMFVAKYVYEKYGLLTEWISSDGGGWKPVEDQGMIDLGVVMALDITGRAHILADTRKLMKGWWPQIMRNERGQRVRRMAPRTPEDAARIGLLVVEGATSLSEAFKLHISKTGSGMGSQDRPWVYTEDDETFGGISKSHYGAIQQTIYELIMMGRSLNQTTDANAVRFPNLKMVVWTALVGKGEAKNSVTKYGPQVAGTAVTTSCPQWLGDCLHLHKFSNVTVEEGTNIQSVQNNPVAFFLEHPDPETGIPYLAKPRVAPGSYPALLRVYPGGYVKLETNAGIDQYLYTLDKLKDSAKKTTVAWKEKTDARLAKEGILHGAMSVDSTSGDSANVDVNSKRDTNTGLEPEPEVTEQTLSEAEEEDLLKPLED